MPGSSLVSAAKRGAIVGEATTGSGWSVGNVIGTLKGMGLSPQKVDSDKDESLRLIALRDPASALNFGCIYDTAPSGGIDQLGMICILPAPGLKADRAVEIDAQLPMATAFLEGGDLWVYADFNTARAFTGAFFEAQTNFYLNDMRTAWQLVARGPAMSLKAAEKLVGLSRRRGREAAMLKALANGDDRPSRMATPPATASSGPDTRHARSSSLGEPAHRSMPCPKCRGSGKGVFRPCRPCKGTGLVR